ncbi:Hypothetical predicted protein, partial [Olea europaea subsp. europaea]
MKLHFFGSQVISKGLAGFINSSRTRIWLWVLPINHHTLGNLWHMLDHIRTEEDAMPLKGKQKGKKTKPYPLSSTSRLPGSHSLTHVGTLQLHGCSSEN